MGMDVRHCKNCGQLFQYDGSPLCRKCAKAMEEKFIEVKTFIRDNPYAKITEVSEVNEVPIPQLKRWIREERLSFTKESGVSLSCEKCGASILTGRFCRSCKDHMVNGLGKAYEEKKPAQEQNKPAVSKESKMRFIGR